VLLPQAVDSACMNHSSTTGAVTENQQTSSERELPEQDEELAILQKVATYFAKRQK